MRFEDPWEFEHSQMRLGRHERSWVEFIIDERPDWRPPTERIVCPQCGGRGTSSLYLGSFSGDEMREDPDFAEDYAAGLYDRTCESCGGRNVVEIIDQHALAYDPDLWRSYNEWMRDGYEMDAIHRQERMMGA